MLSRRDSDSDSDSSAVPLAVVDSVDEGSPADDAGLRPGDLIIAFGEARLAADAAIVGSAAFQSTMQALMGDIVAIVRSNVGKPITIRVRDPDGSMSAATLIPRKWSASGGLLGCQFNFGPPASKGAAAAAAAPRKNRKKAKEIRFLNKKLRQIATLEGRLEDGQTLNEDQEDKLARKVRYEQRLRVLTGSD